MLCFAGVVVPASGEQVAAKHARVELLADWAPASSGSILKLGVRFMLEKGWHIYWVNPGDSGQPPSFQWQLPAGWSAGEIQWPRPERLQSSPTLADYGYHDDVLLMVPVHGAPSPGATGQIAISVQAKWLICREICIPDHENLHLILPSASAQDRARSARIFLRTEKLLPRPMPRQWKASADSRKEDFVLTIDAGKPVAKAGFFPLDAGQIENAAPQRLAPTRTGVKITLKKSDLLLKPISVLRGVLVLPGEGPYLVQAPVLTQIALK